jgi:hypothetical protein
VACLGCFCQGLQNGRSLPTGCAKISARCPPKNRTAQFQSSRTLLRSPPQSGSIRQLNQFCSAICSGFCSLVVGEGTAEASGHAQGVENRQETSTVLQCRTDQADAGILQRDCRRRYHLLYRCIWILSQTGMRGGELLNLKWSEVEEKRIKIVSTDTWQVKVDEMPGCPCRQNCSKNGVSGIERERLGYWIKKMGRRYWAHLNELTASMRFVQTKTDCRGPKPLHGFRAGVATELLRQGASPVHVQRLLRHEDLEYDDGVPRSRCSGDRKFGEKPMISIGSYRQIENPRKWCAQQDSNLQPTD